MPPRFGFKGALNRLKSPKASFGNTGSFLGKFGSNAQKQLTAGAQGALGQAIGSVVGGVPGAQTFLDGAIPVVQPSAPPAEPGMVPATATVVPLPAGLNAAVPDSSINADLKAKYPNIKCFYYATDGKYYPLENLKKYGELKPQAGGRRRRTKRRSSHSKKSRRRRR